MKYGRLPPGWWLEIDEDADETVLVITGPGGQGAAFPVPRGSVRAIILQNLGADSAAETLPEQK